MHKQAAFATTDQLHEPPMIGEATGSVTIDTAAEVSRSADIVISLGKTWRLSRALFQNAKDFPLIVKGA